MPIYLVNDTCITKLYEYSFLFLCNIETSYFQFHVGNPNLICRFIYLYGKLTFHYFQVYGAAIQIDANTVLCVKLILMENHIASKFLILFLVSQLRLGLFYIYLFFLVKMFEMSYFMIYANGMPSFKRSFSIIRVVP